MGNANCSSMTTIRGIYHVFMEFICVDNKKFPITKTTETAAIQVAYTKMMGRVGILKVHWQANRGLKWSNPVCSTLFGITKILRQMDGRDDVIVANHPSNRNVFVRSFHSSEMLMAAPKRRQSHARSRWRNRNISKLFSSKSFGHMSTCNNCGKPTLKHNICKFCGWYRGQPILFKAIRAHNLAQEKKL